MIITVGLKREGLHEARKTGITPDYKNIFKDVAGVEFKEVFGRGRYADFDMTEEAYRDLAEQYREKFSFSEERFLTPGVPARH